MSRPNDPDALNSRVEYRCSPDLKLRFIALAKKRRVPVGAIERVAGIKGLEIMEKETHLNNDT